MSKKLQQFVVQRKPSFSGAKGYQMQDTTVHMQGYMLLVNLFIAGKVNPVVILTN
jgi:hypothetical protein